MGRQAGTLGADIHQTAAFMKVKPTTVGKWKLDVLEWLQAPESRG